MVGERWWGVVAYELSARQQLHSGTRNNAQLNRAVCRRLVTTACPLRITRHLRHAPSEYLNNSFSVRRVQESFLLGGGDGGRFGGRPTRLFSSGSGEVSPLLLSGEGVG